jgi:hypothetical protein
MSRLRMSIRTIILLFIFAGLSLGQVVFWDVDRCLDAGGAFDYRTITCDGAAEWHDSLLRGGGTIPLWILIVLPSAAATFILAIIWRRVIRRAR